MKIDVPLARVAEICRCDSVEPLEFIQSLWSGYGQIARVRQQSSGQPAIVKHVSPPVDRDHKYGWSGDVSHQRKLSSYDNELAWYSDLATRCDESCRVAHLIGAAKMDGEWLMVLEDLDDAGFPLRRHSVSEAQLNACLNWLASFHATFLYDARECKPDAELEKLWPVGTYWHLATRPDEYEQMPSSELKTHANAIDARLEQCRFKTLVHGDAKLANFCFAADDRVAAVDFQYVGGGCGVKDLAYFVSSCFGEDECERREGEILDRYFEFLRGHVRLNDFEAVEKEWRELYPFAWADFCRFLMGWSPGHWKIHDYSQQMASLAIKLL